MVDLLKLILNVPISYKSQIIQNIPEENRINTLYVEVMSNKLIGSTLFFTLRLLTTNYTLRGIYFNATNQKIKHLSVGNKIYIKGKVAKNNLKYLQIVNPFQIAKPDGSIVPKYKKSEIALAIEQNLNFENLKKYNFPQAVNESIFKLHFYPTDEVISELDQNGTFTKDIIYALKYIEAFDYIRGIKQKVVNSPSLKKLNGDITQWITSLPFKLTGDQIKAINDIKTDLNSDIAMRRIVVGDVGSGKTMVILASMVIAYPYKSILMAPTSILTEQLYHEAIKFLPKHYKIGLVTQKSSKKIILDGFDILIGTSALIHKDLLETQLIIVDEQHRFGTRERTLLENLTSREDRRPHFIQLSATPIPRTQAMINSTFLKVSLIEEIPFKKNIKTLLIRSKDFDNLIDKINSELEKNHQVIIVYPLVEKSEKIKYQSLEEIENWWRTKFQEGVYVTHGGDKNKDIILMEFKEKGRILLSTTVVEVGISLPRLTIIVIVGAERLGLATLHQLRGRVSRTGLDGFCYLYTKSVDLKALERLNKFSSTINGFDIASMDLKNRKGGDIIRGEKQSGDTFKWFNMSEDVDMINHIISRYYK
jgi:ATP-dependent DNA helicase RecG